MSVDKPRIVAALVQYDGRPFHGFQQQPGGLVTVQSVLEAAVSQVEGMATRVTAAGRTDAGVHALGQVVHWRSSSGVPVERLPLVLNRLLPQEVLVRAAVETPPDFHARRSALSKRYAYVIDTAPWPDVHTRGYTLHLPYPLDVAAMQEAARTFIGRRDFASFRTSGSSAKTTVRTVLSAEVTTSARFPLPPSSPQAAPSSSPQAPGRAEVGRFVTFWVEADGFLYNMVRIMASVLIEVGRGRLRPDEVAALLERADRRAAPKTISASGLWLVSVRYTSDPFGIG